jgi:hypothetical protein
MTNRGLLFLALGVVISAVILGSFHYSSRAVQNYVTVKGLSERVVVADKGWWAIQASYGANSVQEVQERVEWVEEKIRDFLEKSGFTSDEIKVESINIYRNNYQGAVTRMNVDLRVTINSDKVDLINATSGRVGELIASGILITSDKWSTGPKYYFTKFSDLKTDMLAEATHEAKRAADEFAANSGSSVGKIRRANQGVFQILPGNRTSESEEFYIDKIVRVVSTVDYYLK